jgi:hypothetical protein
MVTAASTRLVIDTLVVGAGAARAGQLNRSLPSLTVRGISNRADGKKYADDADDHRDRAMITAAAFAAELASHVSEPAPPPHASPSPGRAALRPRYRTSPGTAASSSG